MRPAEFFSEFCQGRNIIITDYHSCRKRLEILVTHVIPGLGFQVPPTWIVGLWGELGEGIE